jgi:hypothetical protein
LYGSGAELELFLFRKTETNRLATVYSVFSVISFDKFSAMIVFL